MIKVNEDFCQAFFHIFHIEIKIFDVLQFLFLEGIVKLEKQIFEFCDFLYQIEIIILNPFRELCDN